MSYDLMVKCQGEMSGENGLPSTAAVTMPKTVQKNSLIIMPDKVQKSSLIKYHIETDCSSQ